MSFRDIWILYRHELRSALRERAIIVNSILVPIFLYPVMIWVGLTGVNFVQGLTSSADSRIVLLDLPAAHAEIRDSLAADDRVVLLDEGMAAEAATELIRTGDVEAVVEFLPAAGGGPGGLENTRVRISYDRTESRSQTARNRVGGVIGDYRDRLFEREALARGVGPADLAQFRVQETTISTGGEMGALMLGLVIPILLILMVAMGCYYPAVDATAGERERSTWETTLTVAASRTSVVIAKYLYVATFGIAAALLNVVAMTLAAGVLIGPLLAAEGEAVSFDFPLVSVLVMIISAVSLALLFAAGMMILASFARTFKEGASMLSPVMFIAIVPAALTGQSFDRRLDVGLALIPISNVTQAMRDAINGSYNWPLIALSVGEIMVLVALCLLLARTILGFEEYLMGSFDGSFWKFLKQRLLPARRSSARAGGGA